ncbi:MAG TPA: protein-disulfide reductase DsbD domain-containing protein, partial [Candidatus Nitrosotalea sp.]|nr:protein-disulfide reductase DsbD domain-containing protein [Candidatus Nitrosotalea sp.]
MIGLLNPENSFIYPQYRCMLMKMRATNQLLALLSLMVAALPAAGATRTQAKLIFADAAVKPGETFMAGVLLKMPQPWHTYWRYGGDSGAPTTIDWQLPPGVTAGSILWPTPEKLTLEGLTTYVYYDEVLLMVPLTVAADATSGEKKLKAKVTWLECADVCVQGGASVQATFEVASASKPSADAALFDTWRNRLPQFDRSLAVTASWEKPGDGNTRPLILDVVRSDAADFFPFVADTFEVQGATERLPSVDGHVRLRKLVKKSEGEWPASIAGVLIAGTNKPAIGYEVQVPVDGARAGSSDPTATPAPGFARTQSRDLTPDLASQKQSLLLILLSAFLGGLILNVMPCVLPVIALKILSFVNQSKEAPLQVRRLGLIYAFGVLVSFLVLAGGVIAIKQLGHAASWGMQFQNAQFLVGMTVLVTLIALNLFGVFEVNLGGRALDAAGGLAAKKGATGAFFNGVLATVLATPCTAPFLGAALGFAFTQPAAIIVLVFATVGAGLAAPYVVL